MELNDYQTDAFNTALPTAQNLEYMVLGLASEAGEVAGKLKKARRDGWEDDRLVAEIIPENADVLWYVAGICTVLGVNLDTVANANLAKLADRANRGAIIGSGDNR